MENYNNRDEFSRKANKTFLCLQSLEHSMESLFCDGSLLVRKTNNNIFYANESSNIVSELTKDDQHLSQNLIEIEQIEQNSERVNKDENNTSQDYQIKYYGSIFMLCEFWKNQNIYHYLRFDNKNI
ncbi:24296_t:CDS:2 [Gigaspora margarita]|uniref:24296_t:CDS:1 n=1 Tax=Gigaspora margarita TaxID=4874 RepID=A0ABN7V4P6_GIGMA|nr:24296_t:CDS:2 [Gigaspora margarita]